MMNQWEEDTDIHISESNMNTEDWRKTITHNLQQRLAIHKVRK